jgi:hypothetical protein
MRSTFAPDFLCSLAFVLRIVLAISHRTAATDLPFMTSDDFKVGIDGDGVRVEANDDAFTHVLVRYRVEVRTNLHMAVGSNAMFAPRCDRIVFLQRAATFIGNEIVGAFSGQSVGP